MNFRTYPLQRRDDGFNSSNADILIDSKIVKILFAETDLSHPYECCGILLGTSTQIKSAQPTRNAHPTPRTHFEIDPIALIATNRAARNGGPPIVGYYHSHPTGRPKPSATDQAMAAHDGKIWAIVAARAIRFWKDDPDGFEPLSYDVLDD